MGFGIRPRSTTPLLSARPLQDLGVFVVIYPRLLTACALMGMRRGTELLEQSLDSGQVVDRPDALVSFEDIHDIMGMAEIEDLEQRLLTAEQLETKYGRGGEAVIMPGAAMKVARIFIAALLLGAATIALAEPIKLIVPTAPGGGTDGFFRVLAKEANPFFKDPIVVINVPGAGGTIGVAQMVHSPPDGQTLAAVWLGPVTVSPHTMDVQYTPSDCSLPRSGFFAQ